MKFTAWEARRHIENKYKTALRKLGRFLVDLVGDDDDLDTVTCRMNDFAESGTFDEWAQALSHTIVTNTLEENAKTWRQAAAMSGEGDIIREGLKKEMQGPVGKRVQKLIDENAKYIKSVPQDVAAQLVRHVEGETYQGSRTAYKTEEFREYVGGMANWHAKLISRTESGKAMSALTQARAESVGLDWFEWHTSEDTRVRESHKHMDGVLCRYSDLPAPEELIGEKSAGHYGPHGIYNCRCFDAPIVLWRNVTWPHKVYADGAVTSMSKKQFEERFGAVA
jgi:uncharacterized protein with gpF-like domain